MGKKHQKKKKTWDHGPENSKKPYPDHPDKAFVHFAHTSPPLEIYYQVINLVLSILLTTHTLRKFSVNISRMTLNLRHLFNQ